MRSVALIPSYGGLVYEHETSVAELQKREDMSRGFSSAEGVPYKPVTGIIRFRGCPWIDQARSHLVELALSTSDADVVVFIDSDISFAVPDYDKLVSYCETQRGVIGACYSSRRPLGRIIGFVDQERCENPLTFFEGGKIYPAIGMGFGLTAIHRSVFERLQKTLPRVELMFAHANAELFGHPYFLNLVKDGKYFGEDQSFCERCKDAGIPLELDSTIRIHHHGAYAYGLEDTGYKVPTTSTLNVTITQNFEPKPAPLASGAAE